MKHTLTSSLLCILLTSTVYAKNETSRPVANATVQFMENKGQITDQHGTVRRDIDAKVEANGVVLFVGDGELHYQWTRPVDSRQLTVSNKSGATGPTPTPPAIAGQAHPRGEEDSEVEIYRMDVKLVGANKTAEVIFEEPTGYYENYYLGHTGKEGVTAKGYGRVIYKDIYPNIDLVLYTPPTPLKGSDIANGELISNIPHQTSNIKYDFIINPGGNPADIRLRYDGAREVKLVDGALVAITPFGTITEAAPYSYEVETGKKIASAYKLAGNELSFDAGGYTGTLVIDPTLEWATYYGGSGAEDGLVATDYGGNVYLAGESNSSANIATAGSYQSSYLGNRDCFIAKFNEDGQRLWATYYGGNDLEYIYGLESDFSGNIYLCGATRSSNGIASAGSFRDTLMNSTSASHDGFLVKFNSNGLRIWGTYYGGERGINIFDLATDRHGNVVIVGATGSLTGIATFGPTFSNTYISAGFIAKFNPAGQRIWGRYNIAIERQGLYGVTCDDSGNIIVVGIAYFLSNNVNFATAGAHQTSYGGNRDGTVAKYSSNGALIWSTYYGGTGEDVLYDVVCDNAGNIYATGHTESNTDIATTGIHQSSRSGNDDAFVVKLSPSGNRSWGTYYGGMQQEYSRDITYNPTSGIFIAGSTHSTSNISTNGAIQTIKGGDEDLFLAQFDSIGNLIWATYYGGAAREECYLGSSIATGADGKVYFAGSTWGSPGLATINSFKDTITGQAQEAILISILNDTTVYIPLPSVDTSVCAGDTIRVPYKVSYPFKGGNNFTIQLSDSTGSFTNPINIGVITSTTSDTITCIIPFNTKTAIDYKLRIKGSNPFRTSPDHGFRFRISEFPTTSVIAINSVICTGDTLHLSAANGGTGVSYTWTGPNSFSSISKDTMIANVSTSASGLYTVTATRAVCSVQDTQTILVKQSPEKPVGSSNSPICEGDTLQLTASTSTNGVIYSWSGPSGFTGNTNDTNIAGSTPAMSGNYIVTTDLSGCFKNDTVFVNVKLLPSAVSLSNNGPVCAGDTLQILSGTSTTGTIYTWTGPGSYSASNEDTSLINATPAQTGWYKLNLSLNGCARKDSTYAVVTPIPVIHSTTYNNPLCVGENLNLSTGSISGASYTWWGAGSFSSNTMTTVKNNMQFSDTGWYYVSASVNTCTSQPDSIRVTVNPLPFVAIAASPGNTICSGEPVQFTAYANNHGGTPAYEWYINGISTGNTASIFNTSTLSNGDIVRCDMVEHTKCNALYTDASNDITMTVNPWLAPAVSITADAGPSLFPNEPVNFTATAMNAGSSPKYQWKRNGINVQGATGAVWGANANFLSNGDDICVLVTSSYACPMPDTVLSNCIKLQIRVGVHDVVNNKNIKIYPNPVSGVLYIEGVEAGATIELIDVLGRKCAMAQLRNGSVGVSGLAPGVYIVRVNDVVAGRVVKE